MNQLGEGVEHLCCATRTKNTGILALIHVQIGDKTIMVTPLIKYAEITGQMPRQVWKLLDEMVSVHAK